MDARRELVMLGRETSRIEAVETVLRLVSEARDLDEAGGDKLDEVAEMLQNRPAAAASRPQN